MPRRSTHSRSQLVSEAIERGEARCAELRLLMDQLAMTAKAREADDARLLLNMTQDYLGVLRASYDQMPAWDKGLRRAS